MRIDALVSGLFPELQKTDERPQGGGGLHAADADSRERGLVSAPDRAEFGRGEEGENGQGSLTEEERRELRELQSRDREVRAHEAAHQAAAGNIARGGASFETQRGPDGKSYAVGGEVSIDTSAVSGDPRATIAKMEQVRRAALAPSDPSAQDRKVAAKAASRAAQARAELRVRQEEDSPEEGKPENSGRVLDSRGLDSYKRISEGSRTNTLLNLFA